MADVVPGRTESFWIATSVTRDGVYWRSTLIQPGTYPTKACIETTMRVDAAGCPCRIDL